MQESLKRQYLINVNCCKQAIDHTWEAACLTAPICLNSLHFSISTGVGLAAVPNTPHHVRPRKDHLQKGLKISTFLYCEVESSGNNAAYLGMFWHCRQDLLALHELKKDFFGRQPVFHNFLQVIKNSTRSFCHLVSNVLCITKCKKSKNSQITYGIGPTT